jgi:glycosyltransferase involved in cell wall biosynthesis
MQARAAGIGVVWDNDDDLLAIPRSNPRYKRYGGPANRARAHAALKGLLSAVDIVTTPSDRLALQYRELGARNVRVLENFLPPEFSRARPVKHDGTALAWLAGLEHQVDYERLRLRQVFERLLGEHPDLRIFSIGLGLGLPVDRYDHDRMVDFLELARALARADIGIAPLVDIPWNQARSNVKLKEYGAAGLAWLASPVGSYVGMGEKQGGLLVPDDGWYDALHTLIVDARRRRKLAKSATKWAKGQGIEKHAHLWEASLRDAATQARARVHGAM